MQQVYIDIAFDFNGNHLIRVVYQDEIPVEGRIFQGLKIYCHFFAGFPCAGEFLIAIVTDYFFETFQRNTAIGKGGFWDGDETDVLYFLDGAFEFVFPRQPEHGAGQKAGGCKGMNIFCCGEFVLERLEALALCDGLRQRGTRQRDDQKKCFHKRRDNMKKSVARRQRSLFLIFPFSRVIIGPFIPLVSFIHVLEIFKAFDIHFAANA